MSHENLWNNDTPVNELKEVSITVPAWIDQDLSPYDVAAIYQGGCASGAYMPAVTYHEASETMNQHGDDVLEYIENQLGELPPVPEGESWSGHAVFYLSMAVELFVSGIADELDATLEPEEDEEDDEDE